MHRTKVNHTLSVSRPLVLAGLVLAVVACGGKETEPETAGGTPQGGGGEPNGAPRPGVWLEDVAEEAGIDFVHSYGEQRFWIPEITGSGLGLFDMDADGDLDLYALQASDLGEGEKPSPPAGNRLYENQGDGTFQDVTAQAGVGDTGFGMGCAVGDYNGDGHLDLYVTNLGPNVMYRGNGDGTFEDVTKSTGTAGNRWSSAASFVDFDGDGDEDLFEVNYLIWKPQDEHGCASARGAPAYCHPNRYMGPAQDRLLRNNGDGTFSDVTRAKGLGLVTGNGLGLVWGHIDDRPGIDFYVANDGQNNQFWSGGSEKFVERGMLMGCAVSGNGKAEAGMGVSLEDFDSDGTWDMLVTHLVGETNTFYMGGRKRFRDSTARSGTANMSKPYTGFGVGAQDLDHDGYLDVYIANGRVTDRIPYESEESIMAENDQLMIGLPNGKFEIHPLSGGVGTPRYTIGRGAAFGDIDNDGDIDIVVNNNAAAMRVLRNVAPKVGGSVVLTVLETNGLDAVGAQVRYKVGERSVQRQIQRTYSYCAANDPRLHVGMGNTNTLAEIQVTWLDGKVETFGPVEAGQFAKLKRGEGR